ncbi:MAG TPA: tetratricopeptide repeat protein [Pilimelia sp.]|nr:tetratricopeptide repeat protein [Pilimelia sp.]
MSGHRDEPEGLGAAAIAGARTLAELAALLRQLRRTDARRRGTSALTYRELAAKTGWSHAVIGEYFGGRTLPPTDRFDALVRLLGATPAEQGALATARDRTEDSRRGHENRRSGEEDRGQGGSDAGPTASGLPVPRQLPMDVYGFSGRSTHLAELDRLLADSRRTSTVVISALAGTAGVGKTALAVHWAHRVADRFPDGQLYANLRGFDPSGSPMTVADAVRGFLSTLGVAPAHIPPGLQAQTGLYRSLLADRRVLILLDNARDADQVRPLLPGLPGCLVLVTSRNQLAGLVATDGARPLEVDVLTDAEARQLLTRRLGADRLAAEPDAVDDIIARCAGLPLALAIVAARAAAHPRFPLDVVASDLRGARDDLDGFSDNEPGADLRAAFSLSYRALTGDAARLFRLLGLHPGTDIATATVASLAAVPVTRVRPMLSDLTRAHLVTEDSPGRFAFHDLLRTYAAELALADDPAADRRGALHRIFDHYLHTAETAATLLDPPRAQVALPPPVAGVTPVRLDTSGQALTWLTVEHGPLVAAVELAATSGFDTHAWRLAAALAMFLERQGHWHDLAITAQAALHAARRTGDRGGQAHTRRWLGMAYVRLGQYDTAHSHLQQALDLFAQLDDQAGQAHTHRVVSWVYELQGRHRDAITHTEQALELHRATGNHASEARARNAIGWYHAELGDYESALAYCQEALTRQQDLDDRHGQADTLDSLGYVHGHLGHHEQAVECYLQSLELYQETGDRSLGAITLNRLGDAYQAAGDPAAARNAWRRALAILAELGHPDATAVKGKLGTAA